MAGGQTALLIVVAVVVALVTVAVLAGRRRGPEANRNRESRALRSTEDLVESMQKLHLRMHEMVGEGRLDEARQFARALRRLTQRDPDHWVAHVAGQIRANPDAPGPDLATVYSRLTFGNTAEAVEEYRRVTGATAHEAERVVAAMSVVRGQRP